MRSWCSALVWSGIVLPWTTTSALGLYALHVRLGLGHWPHPMWEQFRTPLTAFFDVLLPCLMLATGLSLLVALRAFFQRVCWTEIHYRRKAVLYLIGLLVLYLVWCYLSTTSFLDWWID